MNELYVTQSDEYCEVYERFMEEYDKGKPVQSITQDIIADYLDEFDEDDGILHDVYFALAKAEWMCGGISEEIMQKVSSIIESGANLEFFRELEATEADIKIRKRNLDKFLKSLSAPREKTKKRKIPVEKYVPEPKEKFTPFPKMKLGDLFAFKIPEGYRIITPVDYNKFYGKRKYVYCYVWGRKYAEIPTEKELKEQAIMPIGYFSSDEFPKAKELTLIGNLHLPQGLAYAPGPGKFFECWTPANLAIAKKENLYEDYPENLCIDVPVVLKAVEDYRQKMLSLLED